MFDLAEIDPGEELNSEEEYSLLFDRLAGEDIHYPEGVYWERGIVIPGGGPKYIPSLWVLLCHLQYLRCELPIEIWHRGHGEMPAWFEEILERLPNVNVVDGSKMPLTWKAMEGWPFKAFALQYSRFEEVLFLDADSIPLRNPGFLFETPEYRDTGAIFWPDIFRFGPDHPMWRITGVPYREEWEVESGQLVIDKRRCWKALNLAVHMNRHSRFYYRYMLGDKDTFRFAWHKIGQSYAMPPGPAGGLKHTILQNDFQGERLFQHRNFDKWRFEPRNESIDGFVFEKECCEYLERLRPIWHENNFRMSKWNEAIKSEKERELVRSIIDVPHTYHRVGFDKREITFCSNGAIGEGSADCEIFWDVTSENGDVFLEISGWNHKTCILRLKNDRWEGRWLIAEQMPIIVEKLPQELQPRWNLNELSSEEAEAGKRLIGRDFLYDRVGYGVRHMIFKDKGIIGKGAAACERWWKIIQDGDRMILEIYGESHLTCRLVEDRGRWVGRWLYAEKMEVIVEPC